MCNFWKLIITLLIHLFLTNVPHLLVSFPLECHNCKVQVARVASNKVIEFLLRPGGVFNHLTKLCLSHSLGGYYIYLGLGTGNKRKTEYYFHAVELISTNRIFLSVPLGYTL